MSRIQLAENNVEFFIEEGDLHEVSTEDGIGYYPISWVGIVVNQQAYLHPKSFLAGFEYFEDDYMLVDSRSKCNCFIEEIKKHGSVDLSKWQKYEPVERDLEKEWHEDWKEEQLQRMGRCA